MVDHLQSPHYTALVIAIRLRYLQELTYKAFIQEPTFSSLRKIQNARLCNAERQTSSWKGSPFEIEPKGDRAGGLHSFDFAHNFRRSFLHFGTRPAVHYLAAECYLLLHRLHIPCIARSKGGRIMVSIPHIDQPTHPYGS